MQGGGGRRGGGGAGCGRPRARARAGARHAAATTTTTTAGGAKGAAKAMSEALLFAAIFIGEHNARAAPGEPQLKTTGEDAPDCFTRGSAVVVRVNC